MSKGESRKVREFREQAAEGTIRVYEELEAERRKLGDKISAGTATDEGQMRHRALVHALEAMEQVSLPGVFWPEEAGAIA